MPAAETTGGRRNAKLLQIAFWSGVGLAPLAALLLLIGGGFVLQVAAVLAVLVVVLIGLSIALRPDNEQIRGEVEELMFEELDTLRDELRSEVRGDITHAARTTHGQLVERIGVLHETVDALRNQVDILRGQLERTARAAQQAVAPVHAGPAAAPGVLRHTETVQVTTKTMVVDPAADQRRDGTVYGGRPVEIPQQRRPGRDTDRPNRPGRADAVEGDWVERERGPAGRAWSEHGAEQHRSRAWDDNDGADRTGRLRDDTDRAERTSRVRDDADRADRTGRVRDDTDRADRTGRLRDETDRADRTGRLRDDADRADRTDRVRDDTGRVDRTGRVGDDSGRVDRTGRVGDDSDGADRAGRDWGARGRGEPERAAHGRASEEDPAEDFERGRHGRAESTRPDGTHSESSRSAAARPASGRFETGRFESSRPDSGRAESSRADGGWAEPGRSAHSRADDGRAERGSRGLERIGRSERTERSERSEWSERSERSEWVERSEAPREESWTEQLLRERMEQAGTGWPAEPTTGDVARSGGRRRAYDPDEEADVTGVRTTDRWASVHSDERGGRELRMGERRSAVHADETGTHVRIEDRWASVRHEDYEPQLDPRRESPRRSEARREREREPDGQWSERSYEEARRDDTGTTRWSEVRRDRQAIGSGHAAQAAQAALPAAPPSRWQEQSTAREDERVARRARPQDDDEDYAWNGGRADSRSHPARPIVDFEGNDDRWR